MTSPGKPTLTVGRPQLTPSIRRRCWPPTPPGGLTRRHAAPAEARRLHRRRLRDEADVRGAIAVVDDTGCSVVDKQNTAVAEGAVGLLVVSDPANGSRACSHPATTSS